MVFAETKTAYFLPEEKMEAEIFGKAHKEWMKSEDGLTYTTTKAVLVDNGKYDNENKDDTNKE